MINFQDKKFWDELREYVEHETEKRHYPRRGLIIAMRIKKDYEGDCESH
jgi:hypothetical protein